MRKSIFVCLLLVLGIVLALPTAAQDAVPSVTVANQLSLDGTVTIDSAYSAAQGFIVIHIDNGGAPGPVAGFRWVNPGWNYNIQIAIDTTIATPTLFAMLHEDTGTVGAYEFGTVEGADLPVSVDGAVVTPSFTVDIVRVLDQLVTDGTVTAVSVTAQVDGFLVIHSDNGGAPGPVFGYAAVSAGINTDVVVELAADADLSSGFVWPMLHVDTGEAGVYEFGAVEGADGPVVLDGQVATFPISTTPAMRVADQIVLHGDGMAMEEMAMMVVAESVTSEGAGFLVIHSDNAGAPGPVLGFAAVPAGTSTNVAVEIAATADSPVTPVVWPMLHVDTGEAGVYEFGAVEGADGPVRVNDAVLTFPINIAPSITYNSTLTGTTLTVESALIDAAGFLVIHADNGGAPGPVLGYTPILVGNNEDIVIELSADGLTETVFPMLHYDTGTAGAYEFGSVDGADLPVRVGEAVVTGPSVPAAGE